MNDDEKIRLYNYKISYINELDVFIGGRLKVQ